MTQAARDFGLLDCHSIGHGGGDHFAVAGNPHRDLDDEVFLVVT
jgi:hypothetical protein